MLAFVLADHYLRHRGQVGWLKTAKRHSEMTMTDMQRVVDAIRAFEQRRDRRRHRRRRSRERGRPDPRRRPRDAGEARLHRPPHHRHRLRADAARRRRGACASPPMVADNDAPLGTAFTVSVDFRHGLTTGISAEERCNTVRALANPQCRRRRFRPPRPRLPADRPRGRRAHALRPHRGGGRSLPARRPDAGRRARRARQ